MMPHLNKSSFHNVYLRIELVKSILGDPNGKQSKYGGKRNDDKYNKDIYKSNI